MIDRGALAGDAGLEFDAEYAEKIKADSFGELRNSAGGIYEITQLRSRDINSGFAIRVDPDTGAKTKVPVVRNESIHYTCFERRHKIDTYKPKNVDAAISLNTPYDPLKEKWKEAWLDYIKEM